MPNDRGYNGDGGRYIREDDDRRYGGRRGSSYEDDSYARRYSDGASNRNTWTEGARSAQGRSNQTFSGRDYEDTGEYRGGMAGEDRYGRERWSSERHNDGERHQDTSRYGRSSDESRYGYGRYANEEAERNRARGYGDGRYANSNDREYYERRENGGFVGDVKRAVRGAVRGVRDFFDDDDNDRRYADRRNERDWESDDRRRSYDRDDDYRYGRSRYDNRDRRNY